MKTGKIENYRKQEEKKCQWTKNSLKQKRAVDQGYDATLYLPTYTNQCVHSFIDGHLSTDTDMSLFKMALTAAEFKASFKAALPPLTLPRQPYHGNPAN